MQVRVFDYTTVVVSERVGIPLTGVRTKLGGYRNPFWPSYVGRNCCVIEVFGGVFVLSRCFLDFSVGVGAFVIWLSQISYLFS